MHLVMLEDFLKRGFPGSAREVAQRMAREGTPASQEALTVFIFTVYSSLSLSLSGARASPHPSAPPRTPPPPPPLFVPPMFPLEYSPELCEQGRWFSDYQHDRTRYACQRVRLSLSLSLKLSVCLPLILLLSFHSFSPSFPSHSYI